MSFESVTLHATQVGSGSTTQRAAQTHKGTNNWFYFCCAWLIAAVVIYGFAQTLSQNLLKAAIRRPLILWIHASVFFAWIALFVLQTTLVRIRKLRWHRTFGVAILAVGATMPLLGIATALAMARFNVMHGFRDAVDVAAHLSIPFNDLIFFSATLAAAAWWGRRARRRSRSRKCGVRRCLRAAANQPVRRCCRNDIRHRVCASAKYVRGSSHCTESTRTGQTHPSQRQPIRFRRLDRAKRSLRRTLAFAA